MKLKKFIQGGVLMNMCAAILVLSFTACEGPVKQVQSGSLLLEKGWFIQQSTKVAEKGDLISRADYTVRNWIPATVPSTVLGALVDNGVYKDVFMGKNLESIPADQFKTGWWYRTEFEIGDSIPYEVARLFFDGINYHANIWLNGKQVAAADTIKGAFSTFAFDVTAFVQKGHNVLAVEVLPPVPGDYYMGFVDWTPSPTDQNMGIFRPVRLALSGAVSINNVFVASKVNLETLKEASLTVEAQLVNHTNSTVKTVLKGTIENLSFKQTVELGPLESKKVVFTPEEKKVLNIKNPRLWWPFQYGDPNLYTLKLQSIISGKESDRQTLSFGIREVAKYTNEAGYTGYKVNGKVIQIRGGGWTDDLFLRESEKNLEAQVHYTRLMNLNTIRLEGFWGSSQKLYDICDREGVLLMVGWSCQWEWDEYMGGKECDDFGSVKSPEDIALVSKMMKDQVTLFRNHPSIFVWVLGSDKLARPELENRYFANLKEVDVTRPTLGACSNRKSEVSGPTGVKMEGPYDYVTPNYWYVDTTHGGAYSFNTETGPGPQIPPMESMLKMIPQNKLWPINDIWDFHCGRHEFNTIKRYKNALDNRYGPSANMDEFMKKAQLANYEAIRPMFEAFAVNRTKGTGVIQWMLNASWPKLFWQLYDYYLLPNAAFYGTQSACRNVNIIYNYGDGNIYATNDLYKPVAGTTAEIRVFDLNSKEVFTQKVPFELKENESKKIFDMPSQKDITPVYFLRLTITGSDGKEIARNFYWLSTKPDVLDEEKSEWFVTPNKSFADFKALNSMPKTGIDASAAYTAGGAKQYVTVFLKNNSSAIAFFLELKIKGKKSGETVLPVFWEDNYVSVLPGEEVKVNATFNSADLKEGDEPVLEVTGWNIE